MVMYNVLLESFQMILEGTVMLDNNRLSALNLCSSSIELLQLGNSKITMLLMEQLSMLWTVVQLL